MLCDVKAVVSPVVCVTAALGVCVCVNAVVCGVTAVVCGLKAVDVRAVVCDQGSSV